MTFVRSTSSRGTFLVTWLLAAGLAGALACSPPSGGGASQTTQGEIGEISADALLARSGDGQTVILDVRTPEEYASGHVPGAINVPHDQVESRIAELEPLRGQEVVVYCERGGRAMKAATVLSQQGFESVVHLSGDMSKWREEGRPTQQ
jgi:phage shock protein E